MKLPFGWLNLWLFNKIRYAAGGDVSYAGGQKEMKGGNYRLAAEAFRDAETAWLGRYGPTHPWVKYARVYRAWCLVQTGDLKEGLRVYESMLEAEERHEDPQSGSWMPLILQHLAYTYEAAGRGDDAARVRARLRGAEFALGSDKPAQIVLDLPGHPEHLELGPPRPDGPARRDPGRRHRRHHR